MKGMRVTRAGDDEREIRMRRTSRHDGFLYTYIGWYMTPGQPSPRYIRIAAAIKFYGRASGERERERDACFERALSASRKAG